MSDTENTTPETTSAPEKKAKKPGKKKAAKKVAKVAVKKENVAKKEKKPVKIKEPRKFVHDSRIAVGKTYEKTYKGKTYSVKALADGFKRTDDNSPKAEGNFKSLSSVAEFIIKKACSGYLFFGLEQATVGAYPKEELERDYEEAAETWNKTASPARQLPDTLEEVKSTSKLTDAIDILRQDTLTFKRALREVARR